MGAHLVSTILHLAADGIFEITPAFPLAVYTAAVVVAGVVTAAKAQWLMLLLGAFTGGIAWLIGAFLPAQPGSLWSRRRSAR